MPTKEWLAFALGEAEAEAGRQAVVGLGGLPETGSDPPQTLTGCRALVGTPVKSTSWPHPGCQVQVPPPLDGLPDPLVS